MMKYGIISFEDWIKKNPEIEEEEKESKEKCPDCHGDGWVECSECGHESKCENCDGTGVITRESAEIIYYRQVEQDRQKCLQYQEVNA